MPTIESQPSEDNYESAYARKHSRVIMTNQNPAAQNPEYIVYDAKKFIGRKSEVVFVDFERLIGHSAKNPAAQNPEYTVSDTKRLIGRKSEVAFTVLLAIDWRCNQKPTCAKS